MNDSYKLFFVCPIGLEEIQADELNKWLQFFDLQNIKIEKLKGGVEVTSNNLDIIHIVKTIKTSTKVLLRINEFKVRDFPKLYNKVKKFNWAPYLYLNDNIEINVTLKKSRLIHSGRAKDSIEKGINEWIKANPRKKISTDLPPQKIHFNINQDVCLVSIDLCGEPLYKRENKNQGAIAPIRENLASALILWSINKNTKTHDSMFIDPMCGSGTFIHEALNLNNANKTKSLSLDFMPLTKKIKPIEVKDQPEFFKSYLGIDQNNFFNKSRSKDERIKFINMNYHDALEEIKENSVIIFNPPYGKRLKIKGDLADFYQKIIKTLMKTRPLMIGLIHPQETIIKLPRGNYKREDLLFKNGGLSVRYSLWFKST